MIPSLDVRHTLDRLSWNFGLIGEERNKAAVRAMNRSLGTVKTEASKILAAEYAGLKRTAVAKRIKFQRADRRNLRAALSFSNRRLRLYNWEVRQGKKGIVGRIPDDLIQVDSISGRSTIIDRGRLRSGFIRRTRFGTKNVFVRQGKERYPIDVIATPSLSELLVRKSITEALRRRAGERFAVVFAQEAKFRLSQRG